MSQPLFTPRVLLHRHGLVHLLPWLYEHALVDERRDLEDGSVSLDLRLAGGEAQRLESMLAE